MKSRLRHIIGVVLMLSCVMASAQEDVSFGHYWAMPSFYNPAATAIDGMLDVRGVYSMQMAGFENAPSTMYIGADLPIYFLTPAHTAGASFMSDKSGLFQHNKIAVQYAYHHRFGTDWRVSGGIRFMMLSESFDASKVDAIDSSDPVIASGKVDGSAFDIDFGLRVDYKRQWYAGVSMLHLTAPTVSYGDDKIYEYNTGSTFYLTGGYNIRLHSPLFKMQVDAIVRTNLSVWRGDITARLMYENENRRLYGGIGYSPTNSVTLLVGGDFHGMVIGYSYEVFTSAIGALHGTHEVSVGYKSELDLFKKGRNKHRSVRYL